MNRLSPVFTFRGLSRALSACLLVLLVSCGEQLPDSFGPNQEILVIADSSVVPSLDGPLRGVFEHILYTPQEEQVYWVDYGSIVDFDFHKRRTNLLIAAVLDAGTPTSDLVAELLSPRVKEAVRRGEAGVIWKRDVWAEGQVLLVVTGRDTSELISSIRTYSDRLYSEVESARNERTGDLIYRYGERKDVTQELADTYGWKVRVPFGYRILEEKPDSGFVSLIKENPARWFFVYWEEGVQPDDLTDDWCVQKRDEVTRRFFDGDRIAPGDVSIQQAEFAGKIAVQMSGLWENEKRWSGGPFKSYAFVDLETSRFYLVDMGVFAPNKRKEPYMRQVDLMAQSFSIERTVAMP